MKISELKIDMLVIGGAWNGTYKITKINKTTCWCEVDFGSKMVGGKWVPNIVLYKNVKPSNFKRSV